jgi:DNA polymerase (family 10)
MKSYNEELATAFHEIADLLSILDENIFKVIAYRRVARRLKEEFRPITKKDAKTEILKQIPGVGPAIAEKMIQFMKEGKIDLLEKLHGQIPQAVREMLGIPHLGPKRVRQLFIDLGIKSKEDLLRSAMSGDISELPGFGDKLVQSILEALRSGQEKKRRHERKAIEPIAKKLLRILKATKGVIKAEIAGSYRRKSETVGDLDILVLGETAAREAERNLLKAFEKTTILANGETKISFMIFPENLQVDIRFVPEDSYGAGILYFTGSKDFNVMMRKVAIGKGYLLNEYGLFRDGEYIAGKTEKRIFEELDLPFTPPDKRR